LRQRQQPGPASRAGETSTGNTAERAGQRGERGS